MGLFSRKEGSTNRKSTGRPRPSVSSEAQAAELRVRARRRLAGAVALVLAAVVVLPMLLDSEPVPVSDKVTVRIPDRNSPFQPALSDTTVSASAPSQASGSSGTVETPQALPSAEVAAAATSASAEPTPSTPVAKSDNKPKVTEPKPVTNTPSTNQAASQKETKDTKKPRSDDGAKALALLEGRSNPSSPPGPGAANSVPKAPTKGNFVVQAASLDSQADAQGQRDKLGASGVSNAFVDGPVEVSGRQKFRVRVGPFSSKEAAQAAQTRLRTLGFGGAYITTQ